MDYVNYRVIPRDDYEGDVKLRGVHILCYKKKQLDDMYPNDDYIVVGETKAKNKKRIIDNLYLADVIDISKLETDDEGNEIPLLVSNSGEHSKLLYRRAGYVLVGPDTYIALLKFRFAFIFWLFFGVLVLAGLTGLLIGLLLGRPSTGDGSDTTAADTGNSGPVILNPMPPVDSNQVTADADDETARPLEEGAYMSMEYKLKASLSLSTGEIGIYFKNPNRSNQNVSIELYVVSNDTEVKIAESGVIEPGYVLRELTYNKDSAVLSEGKYEGKYLVIYYNPETGERAVVESEIVNVKITVTE